MPDGYRDSVHNGPVYTAVSFPGKPSMLPKEPEPHRRGPATGPQPARRSEPIAAPRDASPGLMRAVQRARLAPGALVPGDVLHLQRALGNRAVGRVLAQPGAAGPVPSAVEGVRTRTGTPPGPVLQRHITIGTTQHTGMLGLLDQFLERTTIQYFGPESTYHQDRDAILAQLRVWTGQNKRFDDWSDFIDDVDSFLGERQANVQPDAAAAIHTALNGANLAYAIQGSYAARLHGAPVGAGDIDVLVNDMRSAKLAFAAAGFQETGGSYAVSKWRHPNGTDVDLALGSEFGVNVANSVVVGGVRVLTVYEVMLGLVLRPEKRQKEQDALFWLAKHKGDTLSNPQKQAIVSKLPVGTWDNLMQIVNREF